MALKSMILIPPELWEEGSQATLPLVKKILNSNDHSYNKWTQVRLHRDVYLKTEKRKREPIPIPIVETRSTPDSKPSFKKKANPKRLIGSVPVFKTETTETESETDSGSGVSLVHLKYIQGVLRRKVSHDHTFGVYQDDADGSFKIGLPSSIITTNTYLYVAGGSRRRQVCGNW
jgi:hypothetical protein